MKLSSSHRWYVTTLGIALLTGLPLRAQTAPTAAKPTGNTVDVSVTAARVNEVSDRPPQTETVIQAAELEKRGVNDMGGVVRYAPLVNAPKAATGSGNIWDGSGYTGYNIRGMEGNRVSLDIDGVPLPDAAPKPDGGTMNSFGMGRDYVEIENFRAVEIGSGTTSASRGTPGLGGNVVYVTKSPDDFLNRSSRPYYLGYKLGYASADESVAHTFTGAAQHDAWQTLVVFTHRDGEETDSKGSTRPNAIDWDSDSILAKLVWKGKEGHRADFSLEHFKRNLSVEALNKASTLYIGGVHQDSVSERFTLSATHRYAPVTALPILDQVETKLYFQDAVSRDLTLAPNYITGGIGYRRNLTTAFNNDSYGLNVDALKRIATSQKITYGASASEIETNRPWGEVRTRLSDGAITQLGTKDRMPEMDTTKLAAYVSDEFSFNLGGRKAHLTPGLRLEHHRTKPNDVSRYITAVPGAAQEIKNDRETYLAPSLTFDVAITETVLGYARYKRGARIPAPVEKTGTYDSFSYTGGAAGYAVLGNPDMKKETSDAFEIGLRNRIASAVSLNIAAFYTAYDNYIEYAAQPYDPVNFPTISVGLFRPENIGEAKIYGAEASADLDFGKWEPSLNGFSARVALGRANSSAKNTDTGQTFSLASVGPFKASASVSYDAPSKKFGGSLAFTHTDGKQAPPDFLTGTTAARFAVPSASLLDLTAYFRFSENITLNGGVYNLTDEKYWDYYNARGLAAGTTAAAAAEIERYAQPGLTVFVGLSLGF